MRAILLLFTHYWYNLNKEQIQPLESVKVHENKMSFPFILVSGKFFFPP